MCCDVRTEFCDYFCPTRETCEVRNENIGESVVGREQTNVASSEFE